MWITKTADTEQNRMDRMEWNATYKKKLVDKAKSIIKEDACMKFYDKTQPLYLRQMHLESDFELPYYKPEVVQAVQEARHLTTAYSDLSHLPAKACQVGKEDTATLKERH